MEQIEQKQPPFAQYIGFAALILVVAGVGYYLYTNEFSEQSESTTTASTTVTVGDVTVTGPDGATVSLEEIPTELPEAPSLNRKITFTSDFSAEAQRIFLQKLDLVKGLVAKDPTDINAWIEAGILFKMVSDHEGSRLVWEYAKALSPDSFVARSNLGILYGYYLPNVNKSIENFREALSLAPTQLYIYEQFFSLYRDVVKDNTAARALAEEGRKATGNDGYFDGLLLTLIQ